MVYDDDYDSSYGSTRYQDNSVAWVLAIVGVTAVITLVVTLYCCCKKKVKEGRVIRLPDPVCVVSNQGPASTSAPLVSNNDVYVVPFSALPPNFNYSAPGVEIRGNHVALKDLSLLNSNTNYEVYRTSAPYNPNNQNVYNGSQPPAYSPHLYPNVNEGYQKQASYNPGYPG